VPLQNLNIKPYYDDFDETKGFVHVLFRPGKPVQARELTTLQSILKSQMESFGDHFFRNGSNILDGGVSIGNLDVLLINEYTLLNSINESTSLAYTPEDVQRLKGLTITGRDTGIKATVLDVIDETATSDKPIRIIVSYLQSGTMNAEIVERAAGNTEIGGVDYQEGSEVERFLFSEQLEALVEDNVGEINQTYACVFGRTVQGVIARNQEGTYYVDGNFILANPQLILLTTTLDYGDGLENPEAVDATTEALFDGKIGFVITSSFIDASEDPSLYDNASGSSSFGTEGAHRLKAELTLASRGLEEDRDQNFIELLRVEQNEILKNLSDEVQYSAIVDIMASRTYDESGDYYLNPFLAEIEETVDQTFLDDNGVEIEDTDSYTLALGASKAYVRGYEIEKEGTTRLEAPRPRTTSVLTQVPTPVRTGNVVQIVDALGSTTPTGIQLFDIEYGVGLQWNGTGPQPGVVELWGDIGSGQQILGEARIQQINDDIGVKTLSLFDIVRRGGSQTNDNFRFVTEIRTNDTNQPTLWVNNPTADALSLIGRPSATVFNTTYTMQSADKISYEAIEWDGTTFNPPVYHTEQTARTKNLEFKNYRYDAAAFTDQFGQQAMPVMPQITAFHVSSGSIAVDGDWDVYGVTVSLTTGDSTSQIAGKVRNALSAAAGTNAWESISDGSAHPDGDKGAVNDEWVVMTFPDTMTTPFPVVPVNMGTATGATITEHEIAQDYAPAQGFIPYGNYALGYRADDRIVALEVDVQKCLVVLETQDDNDVPLPPRGHTLRMIEPTVPTAAFAIGRVLHGVSSGTTAIVFRSNSIQGSTDTTQFLYDNANIVNIDPSMQLENATGNELEVEVVKIEGSGFLQGEEILQVSDNGTVIRQQLKNDISFFEESSSTDITNRFLIDTGQRKNMTLVGRLKYKEDAERATGVISVLFSHLTVQDTVPTYFSDASTYNTPSIGEDKMFRRSIYDPSNFNEANFQDLRDFFDFRPLQVYSNVTADRTVVPFYFDNREFGSPVRYPVSGTEIVADLTVYEGRIDTIYLTKDGDFINVQGAPSIDPAPASEVDDAMKINVVTLPPYTRYLDEITLETINNRRYTMRDIGELQESLDQLQEIVSLNSIELAALSDVTTNGITGQERLKLGFMADTFSDETRTDIDDPDNTMIVDDTERALIPAKGYETVNMEKFTGAGSNFRDNDGLITLDYRQVNLIRQPKATGIIKINPYDAWTWAGTMRLSPSKDFWRTHSNRNNLVVVFSNGQVRRTSNASTFSSWLRPVTRRSTTVSTRFSGFRTSFNFVNRRTGQIGRELRSREARINLRSSTVRRIDTRVATRTVRTTTNTDRVVSFNDRGITTTVASIDKMRGRNITFRVEMMRPNTKVFAKFDRKDVTQYCAQYEDNIIEGGVLGEKGELMTDELGNCYGVFALPAGKFNCGKRTFQIATEDDAISSADAVYEASGQHLTHTRNITAVRRSATSTRTSRSTTLQRSVSSNLRGSRTRWYDPIAQSFLIEKDCFVSSVDIFPQFIEGGERWKNPNEIRRLLTNFGVYGFNEALIARGGNVPANQIAAGFGELDEDDYFTNNEKIQFDSANQFINFITFHWRNPKSYGPFVSVEIVTCDNGYPTGNTVPGSYVKMYPGDMSFESNPNWPRANKLYTSTNGRQQSRAQFDYPVYLRADTEYALVLKTPSGRNAVYISEMGKRTIDTDEYISSQPYLGSLFKSQNASTWTAEQTKDLKFTLRRCQFVENGQVEMINELDPDYRAIGDEQNGVSLKTETGSNIITVFHPAHSMQNNLVPNKINNNKVRILNATSNRNNLIGYDDYTITRGNGQDATFNISFKDAVYDRNVQIGAVGRGFAVNDTLVIENISGAGDAYVKVTEVDDGGGLVSITSSGNTFSTFFGIPLSEINGAPHTITTIDANSYTIQVTSPATQSGEGGADVLASQNIQFDTCRVMANVLQPNGTFVNSTLDTQNYGHSASAEPNAEVPPEQALRVFPIPLNEEFALDQPRLVVSEVNAGAENSALGDNPKSLTATIDMWASDDGYLSPVFDTEEMEVLTTRTLINNLVADPVITGDITEGDDGWESVDPAKALSKHVTIPIELNNPAVAIKVMFEYEMYEENKFSIYYKTLESGTDESFEDVSWVYHATEVTNAEEQQAEIVIGEETPLPEFNDFKVMIVHHSTSEAFYGFMRNLRVIALTE